ncbi:MAG: hypothetical protein C5B48_04370 [Candidatus Rokuibacteriota bacterium]|nr:MAG: hypothetical protein C5B48_04370 [Candidatus Rokubacteria bacterium]
MVTTPAARAASMPSTIAPMLLPGRPGVRPQRFSVARTFVQSVVHSAHVVCQQCGTENREGARFCDSCGAPLAAPA